MRRLVPLLACVLAACSDGPAPTRAAGAASSAAAAAAPPDATATHRLQMILAAEQRRAAAEVSPADQQSRDVGVRRAAARALARIGGDAARLGLVRALSDEDEDVIAWGAYGLGFSCKGYEAETVSALVARALSREADAGGARPSAAKVAAPPDARAAPLLDALGAISRAIGRCAADASEPTLVAWLGGPHERAILAAFALGDLAAVRAKLREETLAALLNLAAGSASGPPVPEALYPIGRLEHPPPTVLERIRDVAAARLVEPGGARIFAVRALGRAGEAAASELGRVLSTPGAFTASERAEAARALKRLGAAGQRALAQAVPALVPSADPVALTGLVGADFGALLAALDALEAPNAARKALRDLAVLPPPPGAPASVLHRIALLRCGAAKLLSGDDHRDPTLAGCDVTVPAKAGQQPDVQVDARDSGSASDAGRPGPQKDAAETSLAGSIGARAVVEVIGRGEIRGARLAAWQRFATGGDLRAREAAIELIATHDEIAVAPEILAKALAEAAPGLAVTAAEVIAKQPQRASEVGGQRRRRKKRRDSKDGAVEVGTTSSAVVSALLALIDRPGAGDDPELIDSVVDAIGALALKQAEPRLDELCRSGYPTTRARAEKALGILRGRKVTCDAPPPGDKSNAGDLPVEIGALVSAAVTLTFSTDVGELKMTLDPALAPVAVARFVDLARSGYYDGKIVHRVVPGFVTQWGAPYGDGFGGPPGRPALRCETSPLPFEPLRVGVALAGRDTGSSQLFVTHTRTPHLDGQYAIVGSADGPWDALVDGDIIHGVKVGN